MASSGLAYPGRFYAAAAYAGLGVGSPDSAVISRFKSESALLLYALYQQATVGPCNVPKPRAWNPVEQTKWSSWHQLGDLSSAEAMRLFVKILEEEDPSWFSRVRDSTAAPVVDVPINKAKDEPTIETSSSSSNQISFPEPKTITTENGTPHETQDKDVIFEGLSSVAVYDQWTSLSVSGPIPKPRYQHGAAVVQDKMYIFGGNHNGRYLGDLQVLDLKGLTWSKVDAKLQAGSPGSATTIAPCAGHSLIPWQNKILSIGGHTKDPSETLTVKEFDLQTGTWSNLRTYGKPPISRGGQSVTLVGATLMIFGGEDAKRSLLNELNILDLETMTWDDIDAIGSPPSPRSDHVAACYAERYLLIFGGGSHATCFNDLHILDMQAMEWSRPNTQGVTPGPRAGHAGVTVGDNWYIVGGGNNQTGVSETLVLNMSTLVWSVVTSIQGRVPLASEGLSLVNSTYSGEDYLVSFGGYNGKYSHEVYALKLSNKSGVQSGVTEGAVPDSSDGIVQTTDHRRDVNPETEVYQESKIREIAIDNNARSEEANERIVGELKAEKEELEAALNREQIQNLELKQRLAEADTRNMDLTKELQSVRSQLATEQSRCFKLEVDLAELRQKLQALEALEREVELLQRQKAATEQAAIDAKQQRQGSGGMWSWIVGTPPDRSDSS
ncbi:acyl-CoA-binding domain-containing protein 4-like protein [Carex littledalei]|uniref:Acyl-CoA-binding domain-containing protein 4-like protein n=1 Tax=Carex littledalei TaxID=544730 RepID=A0A833QW06_9POAL|nr:acyl-CoA-binding domain-containing protein 4-like protein [Carex littledalei]